MSGEVASLELLVERTLGEGRLTREEWDAFAESVGADVFLSHDWCRCWWETYGEGRELHVVTCREGGRLVAVFPMVIQRHGLGPASVRLARLAGSDSTLAVCTPPVADGAGEEAWRLLFRYLIDDCRCDAVSLGPLSGATGAVEAVRRACDGLSGLVRLQELDTGMVHTCFPLPESQEAYLASLKSRERYNYRRGVKQLAKSHELRADVAPADEAAGAFEDFLALHREQWVAVGKGGHFHDWPQSEMFHRALVRAQGERGRLRMLRYWIDDEVAVYEYGYSFGSRHVWFLPARRLGDPWDSFGLGRISKVEFIRLLIDEGIRWVEAGRGHYEHKLRIGGVEYPIQSALVVRSSALSGLRAKTFRTLADVVNLGYYRGWYVRMAPRMGVVPGPLWKGWIRTRT